MNRQQNVDTEIMDFPDSKSISTKLSALNNNVRFSILKILRDFQRVNMDENNDFIKDPYYSREINNILLNDYDINITPQMLGQHLKQLEEAELIEVIEVMREVPNRVGPRRVNAFLLKQDAFENLFLEVSFLSDELKSFIDLYKDNQKYFEDGHCVLTVFNGEDKGKTFKIHKDEVVLIGRKANFEAGELDSFSILLSNSYTTVSSISKPHLKIFNKDDTWYVTDEASSNGTYISDRILPKNKAQKLRNNSFIKLSKGHGSAIIYCRFE